MEIKKSNIMFSYIPMFKTNIDSDIIGLRYYAEVEEEKLNEIFNEKQKNNINNEEEWIDYLILRKVSPYIFRSSFFVTCYSFIECQLIDICDFLQKEYNYQLNFNDFGRKKSIFLAKTYLKKVVDISFPDNTKSWNKITMFNIIRNNIVHNGSRLYQDDNHDNAKRIKSFIESNPSKIFIDNRNRINLSKEFVFDVIDTIDSFFKGFFNIWELWYMKIHSDD